MNIHPVTLQISISLALVILMALMASCDNRAEQMVEKVNAEVEAKEALQAEAANEVRGFIATRMNMSEADQQAMTISIHGVKT